LSSSSSSSSWVFSTVQLLKVTLMMLNENRDFTTIARRFLLIRLHYGDETAAVVVGAGFATPRAYYMQLPLFYDILMTVILNEWMSKTWKYKFWLSDDVDNQHLGIFMNANSARFSVSAIPLGSWLFSSLSLLCFSILPWFSFDECELVVGGWRKKKSEEVCWKLLLWRFCASSSPLFYLFLDLNDEDEDEEVVGLMWLLRLIMIKNCGISKLWNFKLLHIYSQQFRQQKSPSSQTQIQNHNQQPTKKSKSTKLFIQHTPTNKHTQDSSLSQP
jgi:hypothetical protein